jgi:hypothetical protein
MNLESISYKKAVKDENNRNTSTWGLHRMFFFFLKLYVKIKIIVIDLRFLAMFFVKQLVMFLIAVSV